MAAAVHRAAQRVEAGRIPTVLTLLGIAAVACLMPAQNDTWWQLRAGEVMWQTRHIMMHDEFTHTVAGAYWPNHEWLTEVVFYGLYRIGGLPLLTAFCAAAIVGAWTLVLSLTTGSTTTRLLLVCAGAAFSTNGWSLRPQALTLCFFAATLWVLIRDRLVWGLPLLFLWWANMHAAVAAGGALLAAAIISAIAVARHRVPKLLIVSVLCLVATAATPMGFALWLEVPQSLARSRAHSIMEWRPASLIRLEDWPLWIMLAGFSCVTVVNRRRWRVWEVAALTMASLLTAILAVRGVRNIGLFAMCAAPAASWLLADAPASRPRTSAWTVREASIVAAAMALAASLIAAVWMAPARRLGWRPLPDTALAAIAACQGPLYNRYDEGGYIVWFLKGRQVFIDSRQDPFPESLVSQQFDVEATGDYQTTFTQFGIRCALTDEQSALSNRLRQDGWQNHSTGTSLALYSAPDRPQR